MNKTEMLAEYRTAWDKYAKRFVIVNLTTGKISKGRKGEGFATRIDCLWYIDELIDYRIRTGRR